MTVNGILERIKFALNNSNSGFVCCSLQIDSLHSNSVVTTFYKPSNFYATDFSLFYYYTIIPIDVVIIL